MSENRKITLSMFSDISIVLIVESPINITFVAIVYFVLQGFVYKGTLKSIFMLKGLILGEIRDDFGCLNTSRMLVLTLRKLRSR